MGTPGPLEIILIFLVVLLIFGAKRIPEIARGIGKGIREFKDATSEISREFDVDNNQRQQIDQTRRPQQGTPQARGSAQQSAANDAPPQPAQANNPGDESESSPEQQASQ